MKKKLFALDDIVVAFVAALGYGYGETIEKLTGWPKLTCLVVSFVLGFVLQEIISRIAFSESVQQSKKNRVMTYTGCFLFFVIAQLVSVWFAKVSIFDYAMEEVEYVILLPILGFLVNLLIQYFRIRRIRKRYGDGSEGYVFDVKDRDIEEINQENQPVTGEYNTKYAVKTRTGIYVGEKYKKTICYLGIPYAKAPVGERRWKAPEPLPPSEDVFEAKYFGASAIQVEHPGTILKNHRQNENCLYLNICAGVSRKAKEDSLKPVLVLFHHGDFTYGGSADPLLYGANYVNRHPDVVFVSFNYRLGIFGFIDFSEVPGGEAYPDALNLGLLDQIAALQWIKENIAAFGGDPERITVLGFESGATSISMIAASEKAKGLFSKAFVFNGDPGLAHITPAASRALAKELLKETQTETMDQLLQLDTVTLKTVSQRLWKNMCSPTCDGTLIPADVYRAYQDGAASDIEFIIGIPANERQVFRAFLCEEKYSKLIRESVAGILSFLKGPVADAIQKYIETEANVSTEFEAKSKVVEQWNTLLIYRSAVKLTEGGNTVRLMYWNEKSLIENLGSGTVDTVATLLGNGEALQLYGNVVNKHLSRTLQDFLEKFINGEELKFQPNEIKGVVKGFEWEVFPQALIVSDKKLQCESIEDRLTEVEGLLGFMVR